MNYKQTYLKPFGVLIEPTSKDRHINDVSIEILRNLFHDNQLIVLRNFTTFNNKDDFSNYCQLWGEISIWPFGKVLELTEQDNPKDHIFDHSYMPLHWDGMYRKQIPEYQIFHCLKAPKINQGGRTVFSNTISALEHASVKQKKLWNNITGTYQREMEFYHSKTISPVITKHPYKNISVIRYNEPVSIQNETFINLPDMHFKDLKDNQLNDFHQDLQKTLYDVNHCYAHQWQENDVVIADNFSLLHGREAFVSKSPRHLQRVQVLSNPPFDNPSLESYK
ncbi:MAG: TauD/TfdA family dioxygenase [Gammaproteobacteria bacterium]|nr:MAG: TauD/TfdA family dioxygenase [Gammaproteobacteria bacterium]UTW43605.1 TauD/TfdA family dioxygenase [bacterium SCSIO 12844]